ncbi:MAG: Coenzyme F420 hydrogenase/dehydrogenase, beta subunit C-terminal domain [Ruminococcus sp.]
MDNWKQPNVYAVHHKNQEVRDNSRSGGIFTAISDAFLEDKGVIYGCVLDDNFKAVHMRAISAEDRNKMRGSKYIQSNLGDTFQNVKKDLVAGKKVLFSGTSCQVAGLRKYLNKDYDNLICIDIVCHGVPSPKVWEEYLKWQEKKKKSKVRSVDFRNKKDYGWRTHVETLFFENGKKTDSRVFAIMFNQDSILRPSCYKCPYKSIMHPGDITIADYWGIEKAAPEFDDNKGVSLVLVNNESGQKIFDNVKDMLKYKKTGIEDSMQSALKAPFKKPDEREQFWKDFATHDFEFIAKNYGGESKVRDLKLFLKNIKRKLVEK